eukprot:gb/GECG01008369.1/.p1 GENE.gb/GECG01008369.1/~~gb/GECG01008369.1/.p1  ORF type:complete len:453 (+),score=92.91 gb/GECG01008369.1/:1-1359(+)
MIFRKPLSGTSSVGLLILGLTLIAQGHGEDTAAVLGVPASKQELYAKDPFQCLESMESIPHHRVNDDYCDCKDGTDEPGTSACPNGQFYCVNRGFRGKHIPSSRVNDGVCDCCDASDELNGPYKCQNTCEEDGAEWRKAQSEKIKLMEEGARIKKQYMDEASAALQNVEQKVASLKGELEGVNQQLEKLRQTKDEAEAREKEEKEKYSQNVHERLAEKSGLDKLDADQLRSLIIDFVLEHDQQELFEETLKSRARKTAEAKGEDTEAAENAVEFPEEDDTENFETDEAKSAREAFDSMEEKRKEVEDKIEKEEGKHKKDYGPERQFYHLDGQCLKADIQQYKYTICPFEEAKQDSVNLGRFSGFTDNYTVMHFENGSNCWNGPRRSLRVDLECGLENQILNVIEPEKCTYIATMATPAVCDEVCSDKRNGTCFLGDKLWTLCIHRTLLGRSN